MSITSNDSEYDNKQKKTNFSTDYMVSLLINSDKVVDQDKIKHFDRNRKADMFEIHNENNDIESVSDYIDNNKTNKNDSNNNNSENIPNFSGNNNNNNYNYSNNNYSNNKQNIQENFNKFEKTEEQDEDYDDYKELTETQRRRRRMTILRELGEIVSTRGIKLTKMYGVDSDYFEMKYELEYHKGIINKSKAVSWMSGLLFTCVDGIEIFSESYGSSYGVNVKGWKEKMNSEINDYYDVLGELYTKYNKTGKSFSPEMRLVFMILSSALAVQMEHMNPVKPRSTNINVEDMRKKAKMDRENNNNSTLNNKFQKEHDFAEQEMEEYRQLKLFEEQERIKKNNFERMKKEYEELENAEKDNNRQEEIRNQLLMMRQNISKMDNNDKKKINNNDNNDKKKILIDNDSSSMNDLLINEKTSNDSNNVTESKNNSKNKSMYSKKSHKKGGGITIKTT